MDDERLKNLGGGNSFKELSEKKPLSKEQRKVAIDE